MRLDRCWKSGLIFLIARCTSDTLFSPSCNPSLERKRNNIYLLEVFLPFTTKTFFFFVKNPIRQTKPQYFIFWGVMKMYVDIFKQ